MTTSRLPVIFLNPNVLAPVFQVGMARGEPAAAVGLVSGSMRDEAVDALGLLATRIGASIVGTAALTSGYEARDTLLTRGLRAPWGPGWFNGLTLADRYAGVSAWLATHGARPTIIIDGPAAPGGSTPQAPKGAIVVTVNEGAALSATDCTRIAGMILNPRG